METKKSFEEKGWGSWIYNCLLFVIVRRDLEVFLKIFLRFEDNKEINKQEQD